MARNDGIDRTSTRNVNLTAAKIGNAQRHNEREKESYTNQDIVPERTPLNIHFKKPTAGYQEMFEKMKADGEISTRGLKEDAHLFGELIFDVNSAYFYNHGGYDFAKQFYADAYKAAVEIVGGEQYILSAVMHADERNRAMSEALSEDVFHYHLHVVYIPVVEKQILWSKRCKGKSLVGAVKETVMQVSSSKKWASQPALDEQGQPLLTKTGKKVLKKSYTVLQDDFFNAMQAAGYSDIQRGERVSSEEHLTVTQFKVMKEQERLFQLEQQVEKQEKALHSMEQKCKIQKGMASTLQEINNMGRNTLRGSVNLTQEEAYKLKQLAKKGVTTQMEVTDLKKKLESAVHDATVWKSRYEKLKEETKDFMVAIKHAPERLKQFIDEILHTDRSEPEKCKENHRKQYKRCLY